MSGLYGILKEYIPTNDNKTSSRSDLVSSHNDQEFYHALQVYTSTEALNKRKEIIKQLGENILIAEIEALAEENTSQARYKLVQFITLK